MQTSNRFSRWWLAVATTLILFGVFPVVAQSGRRLPNSGSVALPTPEPEPTPTSTPEKPKQSFSMVVGMERESGFMQAPLRFYQTALEACVRRLERSRAIKITAINRDMNRGDAVRGAKSDQESYVVWLQLRIDNYGADRGLEDYGEIAIEFTLLEPRTARQLVFGRTYQRAARKGNIVLGPTTGRTSQLTAEYLLKLAAEDAAERILEALSLPTGRTSIP